MANTHIWRCQFHLIPPAGWLNDPNGLCEYQGTYHVFFQYAPEFPKHDTKEWGHYTSRDLIHWTFAGTAIHPDTPYDKDGAFSGCALAEPETLIIYYTGNVMQEGTHDYTHSGRESNTLRVTTKDGIHFSEKECVLSNSDYPAGYTCHIRDPKVWKEEHLYKMVLGGRKENDTGAILLYESEDGIHWNYMHDLTTRQPFGFMWECPDLFQIEGQRFLSVCPQGLAAEEFRFQNVHESGYVPVDMEVSAPIDAAAFREWDMGFDFYAPQTFTDHTGRRILIGWAGRPDSEYREPTLEEHWIHTLTVPRVITKQKDALLQNPVPELDRLRSRFRESATGYWFSFPGCFDWELKLSAGKQQDFSIHITEELSLTFNGTVLALCFQGNSGAGRTIRKVRCDSITNIRILCDCSILEIFLNDGAIVQTTRFFPENYFLDLCAEGDFIRSRIWEFQGCSHTIRDVQNISYRR